MQKFLLTLAAAAVLLGANTAWPKNTLTVQISIQVEKFAEWDDPSPVILDTDWSGPINKVNQVRTVSKPLVLYTNTDTLIIAKPALNNGVLTCGSETLKTAYKISGAVANPDAAFKDSTEFFASPKSYNVVHQGNTGNYQINLEVQATNPPDKAPEHGTYTCGVTLTATW